MIGAIIIVVALIKAFAAVVALIVPLNMVSPNQRIGLLIFSMITFLLGVYVYLIEAKYKRKT